MNFGDAVVRLVVADEMDFSDRPGAPDQGYNLQWSLLKRLAAVADEADQPVDWFDLHGHGTSLCVEDNAITEIVRPIFWAPAQDTDAFSPDRGQNGVDPRLEVWDVYQNPGVFPQPEHLNGAQTSVTVTLSTGDVDLLVS